MIATLQALALAVAAVLWPAGAPQSPDTAAIAQALADAVAADPSPALGSHERDIAALMLGAYLESSYHAHAAGDCVTRGTARPVGHVFRSDHEVPPEVLCRSHGAWQQTAAAGRGTLAEQSAAILAELHRSAEACPAHPLASLVSGGRGCERGTRLSAYRMRRLAAVEAAIDARVAATP